MGFKKKLKGSARRKIKPTGVDQDRPYQTPTHVVAGLDANTPKRRRRKSMAQEDSLAEAVGGHRVIMSGAGYEKGDVKGAGFAFEAKRTDKKSYSITERVVTKAFEEAMLERRKFGMSIQIGGFQNPSIPNTFVVLTQDDFQELVRLAELGKVKEDDEIE